jgi:hypothetical protein
MLSRRQFLSVSAAVPAHCALAGATTVDRRSYGAGEYEKAMVIDALGANFARVYSEVGG